MIKKPSLKLAKMLIAFSFILIIIGTIFYIKENPKLLDPIKDTKIVIEDKKNNVSVTTTDATNNNNNPPQETTESNTTPKPPLTNNPNQKENNENFDTNNKIEAPIVTMEEENNNLRNTIQNTYGITVKYGKETENYSVAGLSTVKLTENEHIKNSLNSLQQVLALYPENFFKEIKDEGYPLTIYLIKSYSKGNVTGVTDHTKSKVLISIATDFTLSDTLNHEVFHYIDYYIEERGGSYNSWNNFNPNNFSYGNINADYSYNRTFNEDSFFVNDYAQTDEYEDRASTFEYMMASSKASCLNRGKTVWLKAKYMAEQLDYFLSSVSPNVTEYWERYIY